MIYSTIHIIIIYYNGMKYIIKIYPNYISYKNTTVIYKDNISYQYIIILYYDTIPFEYNIIYSKHIYDKYIP